MSPQYSTPRYSAPRRRSSVERRPDRASPSSRRRVSFGTNGTGEYAPMPPVFGPLSPSNTRLWSCAVANGCASRPVAQHEDRQLGAGHAFFDHARATGVAERLARQIRAHSVTRVGDRLGDDHTLPRGEAVGLHDVEARQRLEERERRLLLDRLRTCRGGRSAPPRSRARPSSSAFDPSSCAAAAVRPEREVARRHRARRRHPRRAGSSGPIDDEIGVAARRRAQQPRPGRSRRTGTHSPSSAIPRFPGAQNTSSTWGDRASPHASACSRAPAPRTSTRAIYGDAREARWSDRVPVRHRRSSPARRRNSSMNRT